MASEDVSNCYEDIRLKNIERNNNMLQCLGLCAVSSDVKKKVTSQRRQRRHGSRSESTENLRRSARIASNVPDTSCNHHRSLEVPIEPLRGTYTGPVAGADKLNIGFDNIRKMSLEEGSQSKMESKENENTLADVYSSGSSDSFFEEEVNHEGHCGSNIKNVQSVSADDNDEGHVKATAMCLDSLKTMTPAVFGSHFQEIVIQALMQSSRTLIGSSSSMQSSHESALADGVLVKKVESIMPSTWNESSFNKFEAQRNKRSAMTRTSAGEGTDSQEDFPIPENETPHQRSIRNRRLNRSRTRKAKELTCNRKALKKLPYVIHVDGTGRAKGIHKHSTCSASG